ncbi:MAG: hypothetical protein WCO60_15385 [Verrucomicrobiota bacterium]
MEIAAEHGDVIGTREEVELFRQYVGAAPTDLRAETASRMYGRIFTVAPHNGRGNYLTIRQQPTEWGGTSLAAPPFSGQLKTRLSAANGENFICKITSRLHLNPTRGLNLCPALASDDALSWEDVLFRGRTDAELAKGLDAKDNVISDEALGRPALSSTSVTRRYLEAIYDGIRSELQRASSATDSLPMPGTLRTENFSLRRAETYWEFLALNAVELVRKLARSLRTFHRQNRIREHGLDSETVDNSPSITLFLSKGEAIRIYAKTANRIRFEVIHHPKKQNGLLSGGYCAATLPDCMAKLNELRQKAATLVNRVLAFLSEWAEEPPQDRASSARFASQWFQRLGHCETSVSFLEQLRVNGRIIQRCLSDKEKTFARRAKHKGLLYVDESASALYPVSFGTALPLPVHTLTEEAAPPNYLGHNTETQPVPNGSSFPCFSTTCEDGNRIPPSPPVVFAKPLNRVQHSETAIESGKGGL